MANFASLRGPVGLNRVYVRVPEGPFNNHSWLTSLKQGRTFATNGPLLGFTLAGKELGEELMLPVGNQEVKFTAWMRSFVSVDHLQVVCNGDVVRDLKTGDHSRSVDAQGTLPISQSGWCLLRAWSDNPEFPILDAYPYATTSPIYVSVAGSQPQTSGDAAYFIAWIDRLTAAAKTNKDWNTDAERNSVLDLLSRAREKFRELEK
jgi:hypothetical protein